MNAIVDRITTGTQTLVESASFRTWADGERLQPGDLVILNNSFLFREGIRTTRKSEFYLALPAVDTGVQTHPHVIVSEKAINMSYKRVGARTATSYPTTSLDDAVAEQLSSLGLIVYSLVGSIGERDPVGVALPHFGDIKELRFNPAQERLVEVDGSVLSIGRMDGVGVDELWAAVLGMPDVDDLPPEAPEAFDSALESLQEEAGRPVDINRVADADVSILGQVVARLDEQVRAFRDRLTAYRQDPSDDLLSELLRISYNFADGAKALLTLVVGISDLKPLLFWLTVLEQSKLAECFGDLPFSMVGKAKPSIDRYRSVIAAARNRAFHDIFAFGRPFHVQLPGDAFRTPELRLFREHSRRRDPALEFEDRQLVDLLKDFTRTRERAVPDGFWEGNYDVMSAVAEVARSLQSGLALCHASQAQ